MNTNISPVQKPSYIVAIGASAGGLNALEQFFDNMPADSGMAFVVIQHLSPDFKSLMDDLLSRHTDMPIYRVTNGMPIERNRIYLIPPKAQMTIKDEKLFLTEKETNQHAELPIDVFFHSLAEEAGDRAIAIILSGTGSDGSRGIDSIHKNDGLVIIQSPESAQFDGMPRNALAVGVCDFTVAPDSMPRILTEYAHNPQAVRGKVYPDLEIFENEGEFAEVFALLRRGYSLDFSKYKSSTVGRRIKRRMEFRQVHEINDYAAILSGDREELEALYKDLLIGVTEFFRDSQAFLFLEQEVIPHLFANRAPGEDLRVWSAACATGEEAYSLAILLAERAEQVSFTGKITIFATDVHKLSLETAAQGMYERERLTNVSPERLERYFKKESADRFRVTAELRKMVVFAPHNLLNDPPFTKLDLICCRNLLIYFQPQVQEKAFSLFHFSLKKDGVLFLGSSEGLGAFSGEFEVIAKQYKLFRKVRDLKLSIDIEASRPGKGKSMPVALVQPPGNRMASLDRQLLYDYDTLLRRHIPPGVLINEQHQIIHYFGNVSEYLKTPEGRVEKDILMLAEDNLYIALSTSLQRVEKTRQSFRTPNVRVRRDNQEFLVDLTIDPIQDEKNRSCHYHIYFEQVRPIEQSISTVMQYDTKSVELSVNEQFRRHMGDLEMELQSTRENLQTTVEELQTSNEELQATNEELLASNEELQSTNEELHSVNEELYSVNSEFERKNVELKQLNTDHDNLLASTDIGTVFLDRKLRIRKFNPAIAAFFKLLPQDIGRPIDHIAYHLSNQGEMLTDITRVLENGIKIEKEEHTRDGKWLLNRILPFKTETGHVEGVVITFTDISRIKAAEQDVITLNEGLEQKVHDRTLELHEEFQARIQVERALNESLEKYRVLFDSFPLGTIVTDREGRIVETNRAAEQILGVVKGELTNHRIDGKRWNYLRQDRTPLPMEEFAPVQALRENRLIENAEIGIEQSGGEITWLNMTAAPIPLEAYGVAIAFSDISKHKNLEEQLLHSQKMEAVGLLAGGVAHDFNNILQVILGHSALIQMRMTEEDTHLPAIRVISEAAERAADLTRRLLAFSRKQVMVQKITNLNDILKNTGLFLRRLIGEHITLGTITADEPLLVNCDSSQIELALINLATNARDAMAKGGLLTIQAGQCILDEAALSPHGTGEPGSYAYITFVDNGDGMDEKTRQRIFEPFFTTKQLGHGTGLGLAIVYGIIQQHGGFIDVESTPLRGTQFTMYLPLQTGEEQLIEVSFDVQPKTGSETILVAEDDPLVRKVTVATLTNFGYTVITAEDGHHAVEQFKAYRDQIKLLVFDIIMPGKNGLKAYEEIREMQPDIAAIFTSGYAAEFIQHQGEFDEGVEIAMKPVNPLDLARKVRDILDRTEREIYSDIL